MGFQRSVWGYVGRRKLEAKPVASSRSGVVMGLFSWEWWLWISFSLFFLCFLLPIKKLLYVGLDPLAPKECFSGSHGIDQVPLFVFNNSIFSVSSFSFLASHALSHLFGVWRGDSIRCPHAQALRQLALALPVDKCFTWEYEMQELLLSVLSCWQMELGIIWWSERSGWCTVWC